MPPLPPAPARLLAQLRARVVCAAKIFRQEDKVSQRNNVNNWYRNMAEQADLVLDEDVLMRDPAEFADSGGGRGRGSDGGARQGAQARQQDAEARRATHELEALLRQPLNLHLYRLDASSTTSNASGGGKSANINNVATGEVPISTSSGGGAGANSVRRAATTATAVPTALEDLRNPPAKRRIKKERIQ